MRFADRTDAGARLAGALAGWRDAGPVVLGLPRGGVVVAYEVAVRLAAPLDVLVVRKLRAPDDPELGLGAVTYGDCPEAVLDDEMVQALRVPDAYVRREIAAQLAEVRRRQARYRAGRPAVRLADRTAIVVDDGVATGGTVRAAVRGLRRAGPRAVVLAVAVAPPDTAAQLRPEVDALVCLAMPDDFTSVAEWYDDFTQTDDETVLALLARAAARPLAAGGIAGAA